MQTSSISIHSNRIYCTEKQNARSYGVSAICKTQNHMQARTKPKSPRRQTKKVFNEMKRAKKYLEHWFIRQLIIINDVFFFKIKNIKLIKYIFIRVYVSGSAYASSIDVH